MFEYLLHTQHVERIGKPPGEAEAGARGGEGLEAKLFEQPDAASIPRVWDRETAITVEIREGAAE